MDLLTKEHIIITGDLSTKDEVISTVADKAVLLGISSDKSGLVNSFMEREKLGPTGLGNGLAMPHAKSSCAQKAAVIVVKSLRPINWESLDDKPVEFVIALLVPKNHTDNVHLKIISAISRKLVNEGFKNSLFNAKAASEIEKLFKEVVV